MLIRDDLAPGKAKLTLGCFLNKREYPFHSML